MLRKLLAIACMAAGTLALHGANAANVVRYTYDAAGNIVAIQRVNAALVTLSGFAPTTGPVGTAVSITGTGFAATVSQNVVSFNGAAAATITAASASTLTAVVPAGATTGKVTVTVEGHTVASAQDFIVAATGTQTIAAPPGVAAADIIATARLSADGAAQRLDLLATGKYGLVSFDASAGAWMSLHKLALLGGAAVAVGGPAADVAIVNPGEGARLTFAGVAGENLGLGVSGVTLSPASAAGTTVSVYKPDASLLAYASCGADGTGCAANLENLPVAGRYTIIVQPANGATGIQRVWLSREGGGTLASGTPMNVKISRPGQNARLTFTATAGALRALQVRAVATNPPGQGLVVVIRQPDKTLLLYSRLTGAGQTLVVPPLPVTGTYTVFVEPEPAAQGAATATMQLLLAPR